MALIEQRVFSMKLSQDKDFEDNTIYSIIQNFHPSLPQEAAGLLLEEVGGWLALVDLACKICYQIIIHKLEDYPCRGHTNVTFLTDLNINHFAGASIL